MTRLAYRTATNHEGSETVLLPEHDGLQITLIECEGRDLLRTLQTAFAGDWKRRAHGEPVVPVSGGKSLAMNILLPGSTIGPRVRIGLIARLNTDGGYWEKVEALAKAARTGQVAIDEAS